MALQKQLTDRTGVNHPQAYYRVVMAGLYWIESTVEFRVFAYKDQAARTAGLQPVDVVTLQLSGDEFDSRFAASVLSTADINPVAETYRYLKTLPQFQGALDV